MVSCSSGQHDDNSIAYNSYQDGSGYDFHAYPSPFFGIDEHSKFDNSARHGTLSLMRSLGASTKSINVLSYGAKGDGSDDTKAFQNAWKDACSSSTQVNFVVPGKRNYLLKPIRFSGACKSSITMQVYGTIKAPADRSAFAKDNTKWITFEGIDNLMVEGGGTFDGSGKIWWQNSCKINKNLVSKLISIALTFYNCKNLVLKNMQIQNAQQIHVTIEKCVNVQASNLKVTSPEESPNTDGLHVSNTQNIKISDTNIGTGDDCISIETGTQKFQATGITCGPGHGISIGSLGDGNSKAYVSDVVVNGATLSGTTNGVRIKTYQGGSGSASNIKFQNINMRNVQNPIIVDQNYCDQDKPCKQQGSAVQVKNVVYENIKGTSATNAAITFDCSKNTPCQGIVLNNVNLKGNGDDGASKAACNNVKLNIIGNVSPRCS
ncbi:hypothetical protein Leryth_018447 [Lithospermum erythrorhizon]|nr:hypothetical protein Leryth_018447 [Lithospermum erythrorhizon]